MLCNYMFNRKTENRPSFYGTGFCGHFSPFLSAARFSWGSKLLPLLKATAAVCIWKPSIACRLNLKTPSKCKSACLGFPAGVSHSQKLGKFHHILSNTLASRWNLRSNFLLSVSIFSMSLHISRHFNLSWGVFAHLCHTITISLVSHASIMANTMFNMSCTLYCLHQE